MPGWADAVGDTGVDQITAHVQSMAGIGAANAQGAELFLMYCAACHGPEGKGNALLGAPDLTDRVWHCGSGSAELRHSIGVGRQGEMPAFGERLDAVQVRLLVAWLTRANP